MQISLLREVKLIIQQMVTSLIVMIAAGLAVLSGFGFVLFSVPLLSYIYEPHQTVIFTITLSTLLLGALLIITDIRKKMNYRIILGLVEWSLIGIPIGILILPYIGKTTFQIALGIIIIVYVTFRLLGYSIRIRDQRIGIPIAGILGGALSMSTGLSALPVILLLSNFDLDPYENRATLAGYVFTTGALSLVAFNFTSEITISVQKEVLWFVPSLFIGMLMGILLVNRLTKDILQQAILIYLGIIGILVIIPVFL
jgi:hypothetical protein